MPLSVGEHVFLRIFHPLSLFPAFQTNSTFACCNIDTKYKMDAQQITALLAQVNDPDLHRDIVSLKMVEEVQVQGQRVHFRLVLTTPACPLKDQMRADCVRVIQAAYPEAEIDIEMTSRTTGRRDSTLLKGVKNIIAVMSGKGGVGKSTVAANLAVALAGSGAKAGLLDADIYGPSAPLMFGLTDAKPSGHEVEGKTILEPIEKFGVKVLSIGFFVDPDKALIWRGPMAANYLNQLLTGADWGELDYLVIDMPPGTGDIHLTLVQSVPVTGAVIVTTPQEVALADARKAYQMFTTESIKVPVLGLVENMAWFTPAELPSNKYYLFGKEGGVKFAAANNIPLLGQIPVVQSVCEGGDKGVPVALNTASPEGLAFRQLSENVVRKVAVRNAQLEATRVVEITH